MGLKLKIWRARVRLKIAKAYKYAQKIAFAVVLTQYIIAFGWYILETKGLLSFLEPKVIRIEIVREAQAKELTPEQVKEDKPSELASMIYRLESSNGQNTYSRCKAIGKVNGIGYGITGKNWQCFKDHAEEMATLENWISNKQAQGLTDSQLLCLYNTGTITDQCSYSLKAEQLR